MKYPFPRERRVLFTCLLSNQSYIIISTVGAYDVSDYQLLFDLFEFICDVFRERRASFPKERRMYGNSELLFHYIFEIDLRGKI